ncbi:hypothetical protein FPJ27_15490 [Burkholderia sp. MS455]|nr:hypothetical protein FPJ27_15490 [Burkholderia sp. MS455]
MNRTRELWRRSGQIDLLRRDTFPHTSRKQRRERGFNLRPRQSRRKYHERVAQIDHRIQATTENIVGHLRVLNSQDSIQIDIRSGSSAAPKFRSTLWYISLGSVFQVRPLWAVSCQAPFSFSIPVQVIKRLLESGSMRTGFFMLTFESTVALVRH